MKIVYGILMFFAISYWLTVIIAIGVSAGIKTVLKSFKKTGGKKDESI